MLSLASIGCFLALAQLRGSWTAVAGDESTYLAMTESLVADGDLAFTEADRARLEAAQPPERRTVILQRAGDRIAYSKPTLYPLAAAPLFMLFGRAGMAVLNALAIAAALWLFWRTVRDGERRGAWLLTIATFAATGAVLPQIAWSMGDALQLALALAGASLAIGGRGAASSGRIAAPAAGLLLGCLIAARLPNAILAAGVALALAAGGRLRRSLEVGAGAVAGLALCLLLNLVLIGSVDPYRAERATFNAATGYPAGPARAAALEQFVDGRATQRLGVRPELRPRVSAYAALYFLVGRHTGLLVYFPVAVVLAAAALRGGRSERLGLLLGAAGLAGFYLVWMPENYFGGASFVGNRYLLPALALLLPALGRPPGMASLVAVWGLSALLGVSALSSVAGRRGQEFSSQSHAYSGIFRALPYESTALAIEDREDRYFSDEFLRFVDPRAEVGEHGFRLTAGAAPAEILLATPRPSGVLRFLVWVDRPGAELVYSDWRGKQRFALEPRRAGSGGLVEIVAAPAWRRHPFWWTDAPWRTHLLRLSVEVPGGAPSRAELRHLGPYRLAPKFFAYEAAPVELPATAAAGSVARLRVRLTNRGRRPWGSKADVPIHLAYSVRAVAAAPEAPPGVGFAPIDRVVERGQRVELSVDVRWPRRPGGYRVELDLAAAGVELFQQWIGRPIAAGVVEVVPAASAVVSCARCDRAAPSPASPPVASALRVSTRAVQEATAAPMQVRGSG